MILLQNIEIVFIFTGECSKEIVFIHGGMSRGIMYAKDVRDQDLEHRVELSLGLV